MRRLPRQHPNSPLRRELDGRALSRQVIWLACGLLLVAGFVGAATDHFAAMRYGYKSEELRREQARLMQEQRRLMFALEEVSSPAVLESRARELGLQPTRPSQIDTGAARRSDDITPSATTPSFVGSATTAALRR